MGSSKSKAIAKSNIQNDSAKNQEIHVVMHHKLDDKNSINFLNKGDPLSIIDKPIINERNINKPTNRKKYLEFGMPFVETNLFGREEEVQDLFKLINSPEHKPVAITGFGGLGKTSLAIACANIWSLHDYNFIKHVALINAENETIFYETIKQIAEELEIKTQNRQIKEILREVFNSFTELALFIYDNVDSYSVVQNYLPDNIPNVYIIATSQMTEIKSFFNCYKLKPLSDTNSKRLLKNFFNEHQFSMFSKESVDKIVTLFGGIPLGLIQAAAYIKDMKENEDPDYTIENYMKEYSEYLNQPFPDDFRINYKNTIYIAIKLNIEKIKDKFIQEILWCMAYLDPDFVTYVFYDVYDRKKINAAVRALVKYSILNKVQVTYSYGTEEKYIIHRLIQEICRLYKKSDMRKYLLLATKLSIQCYRIQNHCAYLLSYMDNTFIIQMLTEAFRLVELARENSYFIKKLKSIGEDISLLDEFDVWHYIIYHGYDIVIQYLRERGFNFDYKKGIWTPWHVAACTDLFFIDELKEYFKHTPDIVNSKTKKGLTALHIAAAVNEDFIIEGLLKIGCDIHITDNDNNTVLHWAASNFRKHIFQLLLNSSVNIYQKNNEQEMAIDILNKITYEKLGIHYMQANVIVHSSYTSHFDLITWDTFVNSNDSKQFLMKKLKKCSWWNSNLEKFSHEYIETVELLVNDLHNSPFALDLASSYILKEGLNIKQINQLFMHTELISILTVFLQACSDNKYKNIYLLILIILNDLETKHAITFKYFICASFSSTLLYDEKLMSKFLKISEKDIDLHKHLTLKYSLIIKEEYGSYKINDLIKHILHVFLIGKDKYVTLSDKLKKIEK